MDDIWRQEGLELHMKPYTCVSTWHDGGMLEIVKDSETTAAIHHRYGGKLGAYKDSTFMDWIRDNNSSTEDFEKVRFFSGRSCLLAGWVAGVQVYILSHCCTRLLATPPFLSRSFSGR